MDVRTGAMGCHNGLNATGCRDGLLVHHGRNFTIRLKAPEPLWQYSSSRTIRKNLKNNQTSARSRPRQKQLCTSKNLGLYGIDYHTPILNSLKYRQIPTIWKSSKIILLLKPGKDPTDLDPYGPVMLLCPVFKVLERLLLLTATMHLPVPDWKFKRFRFFPVFFLPYSGIRPDRDFHFQVSYHLAVLPDFEAKFQTAQLQHQYHQYL